MDARQADLGRQAATRPPAWALQAWGVPPDGGALRADWERRAGVVASYREVAGITDPAQAIGPPPAGTAQVGEAFRAAVTALALPDDAALLRAMGQGELEAVVDEHDRAAALAPADVQAEIGVRESDLEQAQERTHLAQCARDVEAEAQAEAEAEDAAGDLARLAVADAARREWAEAHADLETRAMAAERELRARGLAGRVPVTDAEVAQASAGGRATPPMDPGLWAQLKAEQTARIQADREAEAEKMTRLTPVTDAELERYGAELGAEPARVKFLDDTAETAAAAEAADGQAAKADRQAELQPAADIDPDLARQAEEALLTPERAAYEADMAEIRAGTERVGELVDQMPDREAERRAELERERVNEPAAPQVEAEPSPEPSWEPGEANGPSEVNAEVEAELEI